MLLQVFHGSYPVSKVRNTQYRLIEMKQKSTAVAKKKTQSRRTNFFTELISEMKKVTWLSRRELMYLTGLVILVTVIMALLLGVLDFGFTKLVNEVFIGSGG